MGIFHHHDDGKQHSDCKICMIQSSIANADTPVNVVYLPQLDLFYESIVPPLQNLHVRKICSQFQARAPPKIS